MSNARPQCVNEPRVETLGTAEHFTYTVDAHRIAALSGGRVDFDDMGRVIVRLPGGTKAHVGDHVFCKAR